MNKKLNILLCVLIVFTMGCATANKPGKKAIEKIDTFSITPTKDGGVKFDAPRSVEMSLEKDGVIYKLNTQEQSWFSKLTGYVLGGLIGRR